MQEDITKIYEHINSLVRNRFNVKDSYIKGDGSLEYRLFPDGDLKEKFVSLIEELKKMDRMALLRKGDEDLVLMVTKVSYKKSFGKKIPFLLFLATLVSVAVDGFLRFYGFSYFQTTQTVLLYTLSIMGIIGIHEFGHKVAVWLHKTKASLPYFIPGIPGVWPTMGAVISMGEPPTNKDSLFDLGISGPIAGLIATLAVIIGGVYTSALIPLDVAQEQMAQGTLRMVQKTDLLTNFLLSNLIQRPENMVIVFSPLLFASSIGFLITFVNLFPAWQLDGGHIARSFLSGRKHLIGTYVSVGIMFLLGFTFMALLILVLSYRMPEMRPLDDVSPLSKKRKIAFFLTLVLTALLWFFTIKDNPYFFP